MKKLSGWMILWIIVLIINIYFLFKYIGDFNTLSSTYDQLKAKGYDLADVDTAPDGILTFSDNSGGSARDVTTMYVTYGESFLLLILHLSMVVLVSVIIFILYKHAPPK